jgi:hypothetical protein
VDEQVKRLTIHSALGFLVAAGPAGVTTVQVAQAFTHPVSYHQRSNRASQITCQLAREGCAERLGMERSPLYRHNLVGRWRATEAGIARYGSGSQADSRRERIPYQVRDRTAACNAVPEARREALAAVREELAGLVQSGQPLIIARCWRARKILRLREVPCTLTEIGLLFDLTLVRIRQIELGHDAPCHCPPCRAAKAKA